MKNDDQSSNLLNSDISINKDISVDKIKTTNVNILLNRVRLDKKKELRKKIISSTILLSIIILLSFYFVA